MDRKMVNFIKEQYPPGTHIRLNSMADPYAPVAPGTEGEVDFVDDIGTIHMKWDNGRALVKNRMPEETERGLMHWYDEADSI